MPDKTTAREREQDPEQQWKCGNEFLPFHPQASHIPPDYRDGWNRCYWMAHAREVAGADAAAHVAPGGWHPIATAPSDGARYIAANEHSQRIQNRPPNHYAGDWTFIDGEWRGVANGFAATHWKPLGPLPGAVATQDGSRVDALVRDLSLLVARLARRLSRADVSGTEQGNLKVAREASEFLRVRGLTSPLRTTMPGDPA